MTSDFSVSNQEVPTPTSPPEFHEIGSVDLVSPGNGLNINVNGQELALFNIAGDFFAISNRCPHRGASLHDGYVKGDVVLCNWHCFDFNVKTGACSSVPELKAQTYEVKVENEKIFVRC
jgi:nitrite reductase/ring-hydroxylating ferredoxin subunit